MHAVTYVVVLSAITFLGLLALKHFDKRLAYVLGSCVRFTSGSMIWSPAWIVICIAAIPYTSCTA
jgi:hypothetical protein